MASTADTMHNCPVLAGRTDPQAWRLHLYTACSSLAALLMGTANKKLVSAVHSAWNLYNAGNHQGLEALLAIWDWLVKKHELQGACVLTAPQYRALCADQEGHPNSIALRKAAEEKEKMGGTEGQGGAPALSPEIDVNMEESDDEEDIVPCDDPELRVKTPNVEVRKGGTTHIIGDSGTLLYSKAKTWTLAEVALDAKLPDPRVHGIPGGTIQSLNEAMADAVAEQEKAPVKGG